MSPYQSFLDSIPTYRLLAAHSQQTFQQTRRNLNERNREMKVPITTMKSFYKCKSSCKKVVRKQVHKHSAAGGV